MPLAKATSAVWTAVTNIAVLTNGTSPDIVATNVGTVFLPQSPETYAYDADGNLIQDGRWNYTWDGENRLVGMTSLSGSPPASQFNLRFVYDYLGRRIGKLVQTNNGSAWASSYTNFYNYDGWNCLGVFDGYYNQLNTFMWGLDLSGTMQGAGGVSGLLWERSYDSSGFFTNSNFAYDGNGNVSALIQANDGSSLANYEYGPFGEVIRATGPMAKLNPFRFSTKFDDDESDFVYYGYRYYNPSTGRWLSKDPLGDIAFLRLQAKGKTLDVQQRLAKQSLLPCYIFVSNDPQSKVDYLGLNTHYTWSPSGCGKDSYTAFIQVVLSTPPIVDDGSQGTFSDNPKDPPLYPNGGTPIGALGSNQSFDDTPGNPNSGINLEAGKVFEVCEVCLKQCCSSYKKLTGHSTVVMPFTGLQITHVGPCKVYKVAYAGGDVDLGNPGTAVASTDNPSATFSSAVDAQFPGVLGGKCMNWAH